MAVRPEMLGLAPRMAPSEAPNRIAATALQADAICGPCAQVTLALAAAQVNGKSHYGELLLTAADRVMWHSWGMGRHPL